MDFLTGGLAAVCAGFFTNPLEVIKTRMQLQGELEAKGQHPIHYKNVFHAGFAIAKHDGLLALQSALVPGLWYQLLFNGYRFGMYQVMDDYGLMHDEKGERKFLNSCLVGASVGASGAFMSSPVYLVKTHLQAKAAKEIAFGHQHEHTNMWTGLMNIWKKQGIRGWYRGALSTLPRSAVGSCSQMMAFWYVKDFLRMYDLFQESKFWNSFTAAMVGGVAVSVAGQPFDLVSTRLYNQGVDAQGKGLLYSGYFDCVVKIWKKEGLWGFYKGLGPQYFRLGPHSLLSLTFWDLFKDLEKRLRDNK